MTTPEDLLSMEDGKGFELVNGELDGEDVLPGFRCRVADLFRTPKRE